MPTIYVIAWPNGVGKTAFADRYLPDEAKQVEFVNADLIARGFSSYDPEAGRIVIRRIRQRAIQNLERINRKIAALQPVSPEAAMLNAKPPQK